MLRTDRRGHYLMISQRDPILKLDDTPYQNTEEDWTDLLNDSKDASYLDLVPAEDFVDRRNAGLPPERWGEDMELKQSEPDYGSDFPYQKKSATRGCGSIPCTAGFVRPTSWTCGVIVGPKNESGSGLHWFGPALCRREMRK